ncbi:hypothetical protein HYFRA_00010757 [Hymenoscyphus fraxineus]|uniref:THO complex subunit 2 n=1 Tax=Hymenoscyphus fraxineus TaxID=746836 RepID=A0A9N9L343_9HELO|nr:hypothetical protein HYFRA_00010757 [Hymenoscyphus fraxineus]
MAPVKRKRTGDMGDGRPSPHRPDTTNLGRHSEMMRDGGNRRSSRGGQGGRGGRSRNDDRNNPNKLTVSARATPTPGPMSPPTRPGSAAQTPTTAAYEISSPVVKRDVAPFDYDFVTDERVASWSTSGRQEVIEAGRQARQDEDPMDLASVFQELARASLDGRIDAVDGGTCVKEILTPDAAPAAGSSGSFDAQTLFLDSLSMIFDAEPPPFNPAMRPFTASTGISHDVLRQILDAQLLQNLGLTRDTFIRVGIRQATHLLYRQANYNLLREESEGYSKLATELFTASGGNSQFLDYATSEHVEDAFERVKGLIGTFDLDVGRVLDITLDVFAALLIKQYKFFVKFLRVSSWWPKNPLQSNVTDMEGLPKWALPGSDIPVSPPGVDDDKFISARILRDTAFWNRAREIGLDAFFELGGRKAIDSDSKNRILNKEGKSEAELDADRKWIEETGTLPPSGNRIAAQLLGFKLRYYASSARNKGENLPANLIYLAALLIKIGFISLRDLYPHLYPLDEDMPAVREAKEKELAEKEKLTRPSGAANALTMAGALADDTLPNGGRTRDAPTKSDTAAPATAEAEVKDVDDPPDQKIQLLVCLLTVGAIPESLFILGRFPWIPELYPDILPLIHRLLNYSIKDMYALSRPTTSSSDCTTKKYVDPDQSGMPRGQIRLAQVTPRNLLRWPFPEKYDVGENLAYKFYWEEWPDIIPVCQSVDDVFTLCSTLLNLSGINIGKDAPLLSKLARIGVMSLTKDNSPQNLGRWQDLLKRLLVPALSMTQANTGCVNDVYDVLRFYPVSIRYSIYAEWYEGQISRLPIMKKAFAHTKIQTQSTMKRISKDNTTHMARQLAKIAYASPGVVFNVALGQIEAYDNLTETVVECARYFTDLGYDVLVWSLMSSLGGKDRNRNNAEFALLPSKWLLALSRFTGKVFKRYSIMNLSPIVHYVNDQLYHGNSTDLVILQELIGQMAGVVPDTDFNDAQLAAMTGGPALRRWTLTNLQDRRYQSEKTAKRLLKALTETRLAGQILISIAQHRQSAIYGVVDSQAHIKMLATMIDNTNLMLFQYLDLLSSNLDHDEFDQQVPGIAQMLTDFGIEPRLAFLIGRKSFKYRISHIPAPAVNGDNTESQQPQQTSKTDAEGDVGMSEIGDKINGETSKGEGNTHGDVQMTDDSSPASTNETPSPLSDAYGDIMNPLLTSVKQVLPESTWNAMSPDFYIKFWASTLSDLGSPDVLYHAELKKLQHQEKIAITDSSDRSRAGIAKRDELRKTLGQNREAIHAEMTAGIAAYPAIKARLLKGKNQWFLPTAKADDISDEFLEKCIIPRLLLSPTDAEFAFRLIKFLHDQGIPNFRTLSLYSRIFKSNRLRTLIFTCSIREAENLGRFLKLVLSDLQLWHNKASFYEEQAWGKTKSLPGFAKSMNSDGTPKGLLEYEGEESNSVSFKNLLLAWHKALNSALRDCLDGSEWMHIRNAITVLKTVGDVFPMIDFMGQGFIKQLETIAAREKGHREDLALTGNAVLVQLKKRMDNWVLVQAFGHSMGVPGQNGNSTPSSQAKAPTPKTALKPTAPEFQPSRASSTSISTPKLGEVEDGEVDDAKNAAAGAKSTKPALDAMATTPAPQAAPEPKDGRSEVLIQRERIRRENAAKAQSAAQSHSSAPSRPDTSRVNNSMVLPDRGPLSLPSRPEVPFPGRSLDRHRQHPDRRDIRDPGPGRMDRPGDRPREYNGIDRRGEPGARDFGRLPDRIPGPDRERTRPDPPPRWTPDSSRDNANIDRAANSGRSNDGNGRMPRENGMPPPRALGVSADRGAPPINPDRLDRISHATPDLINPERAALISSDVRSESPRRHRDDRDRGGPRVQSPPRRHGSDRDHLEGRRDDRSSRAGPGDNHSSRGRNDEIPPPAGPRNDRPSERTLDRNDRSGAFQSPPNPRTVDPNHGRLNPAPQQDPSFGRLNPAPTQDIPSGPRDRHLRGSRNISGPARSDGRDTRVQPEQIVRPPTPEKQPPTGPASGRHSRRTASGQFDNVSLQSGSAPSTPTVGAASTAMHTHPDRMRVIGSNPQTPVATPPMHPDRMKAAFGSEPHSRPPLPPNQMHSSGGRNRPPVPAVNTATPPSGPKGVQQSPITPNSNGMVPPTGPSSNNERQQRGGGARRQLTGINSMLQQAGQPDRMNVRGRGGARGGMQQESPISASPNSMIPPPPPPPPGRPGPRDQIPDRVELFDNNEAPPVEDREKERSSRRPGRHSRRSSRSPDRVRESKRTGADDERPSRSEHRERRGGDRGLERDPERERHPGRSPHRDLVTGREPGGSSRDGGRERDSHRESGRRDGRERDVVRDPHEVPWNGDRGGSERTVGGRSREDRPSRGDDRRGGEGRDTRGSRGDDSGRKRRGDEGGMDSRGHEGKRPRRT